jgi:hypothetical protein
VDERSVCQLTAPARSNNAIRAAHAEVEIGMLSGVEARLLEGIASLQTRVTSPRVRWAARRNECVANIKTPKQSL